MNHISKRLLSLLLVVLMVVAMLPTTVFAAETETSQTAATVEVYQEVSEATDTTVTVDLRYFQKLDVDVNESGSPLENAVTALKNAGVTGGALILISAGTLTVTNRQDITMPNVIIAGAGEDSTTITGDSSTFNNSTNGLSASSLSSEYKALIGLSGENIKLMNVTVDAGDCGVAKGMFSIADLKTVRINSGTAYLENVTINGNNTRSNLMVGATGYEANVYAVNVTVGDPTAMWYGATEVNTGSTLTQVDSVLGGSVVGDAELGEGYYKLTSNGVTAYTTIPNAIELYKSGVPAEVLTAYSTDENIAEGTTVAQAMTADIVSGKLLYGYDEAQMRVLAADLKDALAGLSEDTGADVSDCIEQLDAFLTPAVVEIQGTGYASLDEALTAALAAGMTEVEVTVLADIAFSTKVASFEKVTFTGTDRAQTIDLNIGTSFQDDVELVFNDLTVSRLDGGTNGWLYHYFYVTGGLTYNDCKMVGQFNVTAQDTNITGCDFYNDDTFGDGNYSLWLYNCLEGVEVNITDCTFDVYERAIKMYGDNYSGTMTLNISDTTFASRTADKTVVEIAQDQNCSDGSFTLNLEDITYTGFGSYEHAGNDECPTLFNVEVTSVGGTVEVYEDDVQLWPVASYVAQVGEDKYETLEEAFAEAGDGDTVILLSDVELETSDSNGAFTIASGKTLTLDLNSFSITAGARTGYENRTQYAFDNYADLTITGEGTIISRGIQNYGTLTIDSADVTIISCDANGGACVWGYEGSTTNISAGTYKTNGGAAGCVRTSGDLYITGGVFTQGAGSQSQYAYAVMAFGDVFELSGAVITGSHGAVYVGGTCEAVINSGSYSIDGIAQTTDHCVCVESGAKLTVYGGSFAGDGETETGGRTLCIGGTAVLYGGTYAEDVNDYCAAGYEAVEVEDLWTVQLVEGAVAVNLQTGTTYTTLADALNAAAAEQTVQLLVDASESNVMVPAGVTLDLNGKVLTASYFVSFGQVTDGEEGGAGIAAAQNVYMAEANGFLPIYDSVSGGYRFYAYQLVNAGGKTASETSMKFGIKLVLNNADGYSVLANTEDAKLTLNAYLTWGSLPSPVLYTLQASTLKAYAASVAENPTKSYAMVLTLTGLDSLESGSQLTMTPEIVSGTGVKSEGACAAYEYTAS